MIAKPDWINNLKVGDKVYTIEKYPSIPNGKWLWVSTIIIIENNYIETEFYRDTYQLWLNEIVSTLAPNHRTFIKQTVKNYFSPIDFTINIEQIIS